MSDKNLQNVISNITSNGLGSIISGTGQITSGNNTFSQNTYQAQVRINKPLAEKVLENEELFKTHELRYLKNNMEIPEFDQINNPFDIDDPFGKIGKDTDSKGYRSDKNYPRYIDERNVPDSGNLPNPTGMFENQDSTKGMFEEKDPTEGMFEDPNFLDQSDFDKFTKPDEKSLIEKCKDYWKSI